MASHLDNSPSECRAREDVEALDAITMLMHKYSGTKLHRYPWVFWLVKDFQASALTKSAIADLPALFPDSLQQALAQLAAQAARRPAQCGQERAQYGILASAVC